jgi:ribonuclease PH
MPITDYVGAISVGIVNGQEMLDLCYEEDSNAEVDMNIIMSGSGEFIEIQGTGEKAPFSRKQINGMIDIAEQGIFRLFEVQKETLGKLTNEIGRVTKDEKIHSSD